MKCEFEDKVFKVDAEGFDDLALDIFRFQAEQNLVYRSFLQALGKRPGDIRQVRDIPFLPVSFFKSHEVRTGEYQAAGFFESSGTTGSINSRHYIRDFDLYRKSFGKGFRSFYGDPSGWVIIGLLPSYLERQNSSLVMMVDELIRDSRQPESGFYLNEFSTLASLLEQLEEANRKVLLIGVSFALVDFAASYPMPLNSTIIMETGGMKGRKREMTREELHSVLKNAFGVHAIHSEYGMTELLSQAYAYENGLFTCPPWMKVLLRQEDDPLCVADVGQVVQNGLINIIDLANIYSCSFIATDDIGKLHPGNHFEVIGRMDNSDLRGCSLMVS